ncbi:MAG: 50S ribosomal protein L23 [Mycoplasmataceae bacterium]|nr:50S ribosomal protein L23 [Mycoplasmataceae bacterium]
MNTNIYSVIKGFVETEKALALQAIWKYTFKVVQNSEKIAIAKSVENLYWVTVTSVNTLPTRKKERIIWRWKIFTKRDAWVKAIVTLKKWDKIDFTSFSTTKKKEEKAKK